MIQRTEYGMLVPFEEWDEIQEKLKETTSQDLEKENKDLREVLDIMTIFLNKAEDQAQVDGESE